LIKEKIKIKKLSFIVKFEKRLSVKIAIFGGSFDPVHLGHVEIVKKALQYIDIDKIIIMPNYLNPLKHLFHAPAQFRFKWLKDVFKNIKNVEISDFEISKNRPVYSIETINKFKPNYFIIGSDNLKLLDKWKSIDEILKKTEFIVAKRGDIDKTILNKYNIKKILDIDIPISSTQIRNGKCEYVPRSILDEVKEFYKCNQI
jgi:nicotinate-nucleotide adenylyltransferase